MYGGNWAKRLCNACYGGLLSLYEIKAGTGADDERAEGLAPALVAMVGTDDVRQAEKLFQASEDRAARLSPETLRFIATAEYVAGRLDADPQLEWSPAVIGLCKAIEAELNNRVLRPLAAVAARENLNADRQDKDIGKVAVFCADPKRKPPELGAFAHFLRTVIQDAERRGRSPLIGAFFKLASGWPGSHGSCSPLDSMPRCGRSPQNTGTGQPIPTSSARPIMPRAGIMSSAGMALSGSSSLLPICGLRSHPRSSCVV